MDLLARCCNRYQGDNSNNLDMHANPTNLLALPDCARELKRTYAPLRDVVVQAVATDAIVPTLSATLEYFKYASTKDDLPTRFMEAQMDYFGEHMFDDRADPPGEPVTGQHHFEWKPARGEVDEKGGDE